MNNICKVCILFLLVIWSGKTLAQGNDFGIWTSLQAEKKILPGLEASAEGEYRTRDNTGTTDRWALSAELSYRIIKYLKVGGSYSMIRFNHQKRGWETGHRYNLYTQGSYKWNRLNISLRERYQHTYRVGAGSSSKRANPKDILRSRLQMAYDIRKNPFTPYVSCELFHTLNDPQENGLDKTRYTVGTRYKINKHNSLNTYYRFQSKEDDDEPNGHVWGIGYTYKF